MRVLFRLLPGPIWRRFLSAGQRRCVCSVHDVLRTASNADHTFLRSNTARVDVPSLRDMSLNLLDRTSEMNRYTEEDIERPPLNGLPPFWAFLWPGGYGLTRYIQENTSVISAHNATVVDFGCGCGSASIAALSAGARVVLSNDIDPLAILATAMNCTENGIDTAQVYCTTTNCLDKSTDELLEVVSRCEGSGGSRELKSHDTHQRVLLVGDMLYDGDIGPSVLKLVNEVLERNWVVYIGDPGRDFANRHLQHMRSDILGEYELPDDIKRENNGIYSVCVRRVYM